MISNHVHGIFLFSLSNLLIVVFQFLFLRKHKFLRMTIIFSCFIPKEW
ncbi:hypothetical protein PROVRETT_07706 [Providencia rettgeri DSM 1131]|nr:hypothetical protein PROVRETT_07706 [Providencia rettgeri DSM 1131]